MNEAQLMSTSREPFSVRVIKNIIHGSNFCIEITSHFFQRAAEHFTDFDIKQLINAMEISWHYSSFAVQLKVVQKCLIFDQ